MRTNSTLKIFFLALCTLVFSACKIPTSPGDVELNKEFTIRVGESVIVKDENYKISFDTVGDDSRCPIPVTCVWEGNASALFTLSRTDLRVAARQFTLNTAHGENYPHKAEYLGYEIELVKLTPYPEQGKTPIAQKDYVATVIVRKL